jgi:hypothetical protein
LHIAGKGTTIDACPMPDALGIDVDILDATDGEERDRR